ncbi:MAG: hypothetical protein KA015_03920 [Spirochaetes bacterium]|nr:hypothetical protein [Spirochaetota bacterium]
MRKIVFLGIIVSLNLFAFSDQTNTERIVKENKEYIEFIDLPVSNFGDKESENFFKIYLAHFNAEVAFLQSDYKRSFRKIFEAQKMGVILYEKILTDYYLEDSKDLLDRMAPFVIKSKNSLARLYLSLGYRDRAQCATIKRSADASHPRLRSYKINQYIESIKYARRSMRYALLALFEAQDVEMKKYILAHMIEAERERNNPFYERFLKKQDSEIVEEINRDFDSYDKEYVQKAAAKKKEYDDAKKPLDPDTEKYLGELRTERRVRFKDEKMTAEYIRNGEFAKAEDIIRKYVDDMNFKIINATLEVEKTSEGKEKADYDYEKIRVHHLDNNSRYSKDSYLEGFYKKAKIVDDISKKDNDSEEVKKEEVQPEIKTDTVVPPKESVEK